MTQPNNDEVLRKRLHGNLWPWHCLLCV